MSLNEKDIKRYIGKTCEVTTFDEEIYRGVIVETTKNCFILGNDNSQSEFDYLEIKEMIINIF